MSQIWHQQEATRWMNFCMESLSCLQCLQWIPEAQGTLFRNSSLKTKCVTSDKIYYFVFWKLKGYCINLTRICVNNLMTLIIVIKYTRSFPDWSIIPFQGLLTTLIHLADKKKMFIIAGTELVQLCTDKINHFLLLFHTLYRKDFWANCNYIFKYKTW